MRAHDAHSPDARGDSARRADRARGGVGTDPGSDALTRDRLHAELESIWTETRKTVVFVTHNVREAVALGDRVLVFSPRPGRIVAEFRIDLPRPRSLEDHQLVSMASDIMTVLRDAMGTQEQEEIHGKSN